MAVSRATLAMLEQLPDRSSWEMRLITVPSVVFAAVIAYLAHF
jgi:hypothetical protein